MAQETWQIDPVHSCIHFSIRHFVISKIHGRFTKWGGTIHLDEASPAASDVSVEIDATSVDTNDAKRDGHLQSPDFFNTAEHPKITFRSTSVESAGPGKYKVTGDLTLRGVTKPVTLNVEHGGSVKDPWGNQRGGFSLKGDINRQEFGMTFNAVLEAGGVALGDNVEFSIDVEATKAMQAGAD
ncbi:MAG: polyisoprenoid-binding protein [Terriglobia bacterium]|nr:MAG: polyisoprenoid-binding protein [Terriglobia bacterium]